MKDRVKYNNEIIDVIQVGTKTHLFDLNNVEFLDNPQDYWTRLEHQYAGMAMQGILANIDLLMSLAKKKADDYPVKYTVAEFAEDCAHALVEKLKEMEERK